MSEELRLLFAYLNATYTITAIENKVFQGAMAASEFLTYAATKLYLCKSIICGYNSSSLAVAGGYVSFNDAADAASLYLANISPVWNAGGTPAMNYAFNYIQAENFFFSRLVNSGYTNIRFIGYVLTKT